MKASESNLLRFISGPKQFIIPNYHRQYSWSIKECEQLWNDIINASEKTSTGHFIGSIVYNEGRTDESNAIAQLELIDGEQRLVTVLLLLKVLGKALDEAKTEGPINGTYINNHYLVNNKEDHSIRSKFIPATSDKNTLINLIEEVGMPQNFSKKIIQNYKFFESQLVKNGIDPLKLYNGIKKLFIVDVLFEYIHNPQLLFERLNFSGLRSPTICNN